MLNGPETHFLKERRRKSKRENMGDIPGTGFFDQRFDDGTAGSTDRFVGRCRQTEDLRCTARVLFKPAASHDLAIEIGDDIVR